MVELFCTELLLKLNAFLLLSGLVGLRMKEMNFYFEQCFQRVFLQQQRLFNKWSVATVKQVSLGEIVAAPKRSYHAVNFVVVCYNVGTVTEKMGMKSVMMNKKIMNRRAECCTTETLQPLKVTRFQV